MIDEALCDDTDKTGARWHSAVISRLLLRPWSGSLNLRSAQPLSANADL